MTSLLIVGAFVVVLGITFWFVFKPSKKVDLLNMPVSTKTGENIKKAFKLLGSQGKSHE